MDNDETVHQRFASVTTAAYLDVLLPKSPDFDALHVLNHGSPEEIAGASQRRNLFFGTRPPAYRVNERLTEM